MRPMPRQKLTPAHHITHHRPNISHMAPNILAALAPNTDPPIRASAEQALAIVEANDWIGKLSLDLVRSEISQFPQANATTVLQHLQNADLLTKEQTAELKILIQHQESIPQFIFIKKLGSGGMGTVFLVRDHEDRLLALKTINARLSGYEDFAGRFQRETTSLEGIVHPHIANVIKSGETNGVCFLAMEYINGPSLAALLTEAGALPESYALNVIQQIAEGLAHVWNTAKLVHRDIKPENILIIREKNSTDHFPPGDVAKLIDFGLVKPSNEPEDMHLTQTGMTIGTPIYMSPEQIRGEMIDCRSDIYGLSATLYHLMTGVTPFAGSSPGAIMSAHLTQQPPDPGDRVPSLNASTRALVMMGMAKSLDERFANYEAFLNAIQESLKEIHGRSGTQVKLLRKPMVLKGLTQKIVKKAAAPIQKKEESGRLALKNDAGEFSEPEGLLSARIVNKHKNHSDASQALEAVGIHAGILNTIIHTSEQKPTPSEPAVGSISEEFHQLRTDRIKNLQIKRVINPDLTLDDIKLPDKKSSADSVVYQEDPKIHVTMGLMPWLTLASSALLLTVYLTLSALNIIK